jgi:O-antigen/teichoic acid export membrane protein
VKYIKAILANYLLYILNTLCFLVLTPLAIHVMGEEYYGLFSILNAVLLFSSVGNLGISSVITKFIAAEDKDSAKNDSIVTTGFLVLIPMGLISTIIIILIRGWLALKITSGPLLQKELSWALLFTGLSLLPQFLSKVPYGFLLAHLKNRTAKFTDFLSILLMWGGGIIIFLLRRNLVLIAFWGLIVQIIILILLVIMSLKVHKWHWRYEKNTFSKMFSFSIFTFLQSIAVLLFQQFDRIIVGTVLGPISAGVYSVGTSLGGRISTIAGQATDVMIPFASKKNANNSQDDILTVFRDLCSILSLFIAMLGSLLIIWIPQILTVWISRDYATKYSLPFQIIILAYSILSLSRPGDQTLTGLGKVKITSIIYFITSILMLSGVYFFSKHFDLIGAAYANLIISILIIFNYVVFYYLEKKKAFQLSIKSVIWGIIPPIITLIITNTYHSIIVQTGLTIVITTITSIFIFQNQIIKEKILPFIIIKIKTANEKN